jgi:putative membrane-bound dehydrogenase-like protein
MAVRLPVAGRFPVSSRFRSQATSLAIALLVLVGGSELSGVSGVSRAAEFVLGDHRFTLPDGLEIEKVAEAPDVLRPVHADFDEVGRLYVADSSGSNAPVQQQLEEKPHRIVRLEDTNGDGRFDQSIVFAESMMFPEGVLWHEGSLYVAAPPSIWKLTDTTGDGRADQREEWFEGKTLTGCANDLHGPFLGLDGWIYWCKGAFAEQTYERPGQSPWVTRASHIFRRDPRSGVIEHVMTGGMDNPVELVFTPGGERIFSTTFLQHPEGGKRDGLIHAIYGGVYGKVHSVLDGHPRTGGIMPPLTHLGAAAPAGLALVQSDALGDEYQHNVLASLFNMHKVTRHQLVPDGATFQTIDHDLVVSDNIDFHPTDVLEDADGSLLIIDTGGWFKLCCPTSHLEKADVLGGIYRVRRTGSTSPDDPRGTELAWDGVSAEELVSRIEDSRIAVRQQAMNRSGLQGKEAVAPLKSLLEHSDPAVRRSAVWTLCRIDDPAARDAIRQAVGDGDEQVRQAALHAIGLWRDSEAVASLVEVLQSGEPHQQRAACEALGRIGDSTAIPHLLGAVTPEIDRTLEHSIIYALYEIGDVPALKEAMAHVPPSALHAVLYPLEQLQADALQPAPIISLLNSEDSKLRETALWIVDRHPAWVSSVRSYLERQIALPLPEVQRGELENQLARFGRQPEMREMITQSLANRQLPVKNRLSLLGALARLPLQEIPEDWSSELARMIREDEQRIGQQVIATVSSWRQVKQRSPELVAALLEVAASDQWSDESRLSAMLALGPKPEIGHPLFEFVLQRLGEEHPVPVRMRAADILSTAKLTLAQLYLLADRTSDLGPMELGRVLPAFAQSSDVELGKQLLATLERSPSIVSIPVPTLRMHLEHYGDQVQQEAERLYGQLDADAEKEREYFEQLLTSLEDESGDIRRGQAIFYGAKAACSTCHAIGYLGGKIGPDLTKIGGIRNRRDLLESIVFPSASFVRSYEPVVVVTVNGQVYSGNLQEDSDEAVVLILAADQTVRIPREEIEEMRPGKTSIMPAGLDKQLTPGELADLLAFLQNAK